MQVTDIAWTTMSSNAIKAVRLRDGKRGHACVMISPGCANCYAGALNIFRGTGLPYTAASIGQFELVLDEREFAKWAKIKKPTRVFLCSMTDIFWDQVPDEWLEKITAAMRAAPEHVTFQVLTKRPERMARWFVDQPVMPNVWLGFSAENNEWFWRRFPQMTFLHDKGWLTWCSAEPLIGEINLGTSTKYLDWLVIGGESGKARVCDFAWIRSLIEQCRAGDVRCFVKQLGKRPVGEWKHGEPPMVHVSGVGYPVGGRRELSQYKNGVWRLRNKAGADPSEWPEDLRVREYPEEKAFT